MFEILDNCQFSVGKGAWWQTQNPFPVVLLRGCAGHEWSLQRLRRLGSDGVPPGLLRGEFLGFTALLVQLRAASLANTPSVLSWVPSV